MNTLSETSMARPMKVSLWLFNPFHIVAGLPALTIGLLLLVASGFLASLSNSHFDGVLDFHTGAVRPVWFPVVECLINWVVMSVLLLVSGMLVSKSHIRPVDVFGTQALARAPSLVTACAALLPGFQEGCQFLLLKTTGQVPPEISASDWAVFSFVTVTAVLMVVWMVFLMYRGFTVACNVWMGKAIAVFIPALIVGEVVSKVLILMLIAMS